MDELIKQLKKILADIFEQTERRLKIEQIDLSEFDESLGKDEIIDELDLGDSIQKYREKIVEYKSDNSFWEKDIPNLISVIGDFKGKNSKLSGRLNRNWWKKFTE